MKNILIAAGIVAGAATGVILYMRNRKMALAALDNAAEEVHHAKKSLRGYLRKNNRHMEHSLS
jgi:hypothetical protein